MSLTKIGSIGINTGIAFAGVTTIVTLNTANDALSIGATVNVGSGITLGASGDIFATGITTVSGNVKVGTGITLSPDGDVFFTGIATGNGSGLTALNASNISSGTVPTARLGSGTASSSTFLRGDSTFATVTSVGGATGVDFNDSVKARFGTDNDLELYHTGGSGYLDNNTGSFYILSDTFEIRGTNANETHIKTTDNGAVELYHDNTKKFETTSGGATFSDNVEWPDNKGVRFGGGEDLKLYHDGTDSFIDNATGGLKILGDTIRLKGKSADENMVVASVNGAVELYHNNEQKLYTATNGAIINSEGDTTLGIYGGSGGSGYAQLYLNGSGTSNNYVHSDNGLIMWINGANRAKFETDGTFIVQDGDVKINTAGHGIDFSATSDASGMTSELLDDYEEGTWTPTATNFTKANQYSTTYTKIGNVVYVQMYITAASGSGTGAVSIGGLPYTMKESQYYGYGCGRIGGATNAQNDIVFQFNSGSATFTPFIADGNINEQMISGQHLIMSGFYHAA